MFSVVVINSAVAEFTMIDEAADVSNIDHPSPPAGCFPVSSPGPKVGPFIWRSGTIAIA